MSDDREMKSGSRNADDAAPDEEVKLHVKQSRSMDDSPDAKDDDNDVEAHVKKA
jgi:hypothetical protein